MFYHIYIELIYFEIDLTFPRDSITSFIVGRSKWAPHNLHNISDLRSHSRTFSLCLSVRHFPLSIQLSPTTPISPSFHSTTTEASTISRAPVFPLSTTSSTLYIYNIYRSFVLPILYFATRMKTYKLISIVRSLRYFRNLQILRSSLPTLAPLYTFPPRI